MAVPAGYSRVRGAVNNEYDKTVREHLVAGNGIFYPNANSEFRKRFRTRWVSQLRTVGLRLRTFIGVYEGQTGSYYWTEKRPNARA